MSAWLWFPLVLTVFGVISTVASVGKPRNPIDGPTAVAIVVIQAVVIVCILKGGGAL